MQRRQFLGAAGGLAALAATPALAQSPPSYDKQFVRDHLLAIQWDQKPPGPKLPADVIMKTRDKYLTALKALVG